MSEKKMIQKEMKNPLTLFDIPDGKKVKVLGYDDKITEMPTKILEMGILPETEVVVLHRAPFSGPLYVEYGEEDTCVALRSEEAKFILVEYID